MDSRMRWTEDYWWEDEAPVSPFAKGCLNGLAISAVFWVGAYLLWRWVS
jgi:hypothetical protein